MSLPIGRGSMQVRSCGLVAKRDGIGRVGQGRDPKEREIKARVIIILLRRNSTKEPHRDGK
jgi:hypothetical protein